MSDGELVELIERQSEVISTQAKTIDQLFKILAQHIAADEAERETNRIVRNSIPK